MAIYMVFGHGNRPYSRTGPYPGQNRIQTLAHQNKLLRYDNAVIKHANHKRKAILSNAV